MSAPVTEADLDAHDRVERAIREGARRICAQHCPDAANGSCRPCRADNDWGWRYDAKQALRAEVVQAAQRARRWSR